MDLGRLEGKSPRMGTTRLPRGETKGKKAPHSSIRVGPGTVLRDKRVGENPSYKIGDRRPLPGKKNPQTARFHRHEMRGCQTKELGHKDEFLVVYGKYNGREMYRRKNHGSRKWKLLKEVGGGSINNNRKFRGSKKRNGGVKRGEQARFA